MIDAGNFASTLTYLGSHIVEMEYKSNLVSLGSGFPLNLEMKSEPSLSNENKDVWLGRVALEVSVQGEAHPEGQEPQYLKLRVKIEGDFSAPKQLEEDQFAQLIALNGSTSLYSILRGTIESITSQSLARGKVSLPMINMIECLKNNSIENTIKDKTQ